MAENKSVNGVPTDRGPITPFMTGFRTRAMASLDLDMIIFEHEKTNISQLVGIIKWDLLPAGRTLR